MSPEQAVELINAEKHSMYALDAQFSGGGQRGAYRIIAADGSHAVLKIHRNPGWINQIQRARAATDRLRSLGYPAPVYMVTGSTDQGTYSLLSEMPGEKLMGDPTPDQINSLMQLIELQKGQSIPEVQGQDWDWYIMDTLFSGESANFHSLMQFSAETSALAFDLKSLVADFRGKALPNADLVHGDMHINQALFYGQAVSGVLDWDQVGYGDRTIDLVGLWYSLIGLPPLRDAVMDRMRQISDVQAIKIYGAHRILLAIGWEINKKGGDAPTALIKARAGLDLLRQLPQI